MNGYRATGPSNGATGGAVADTSAGEPYGSHPEPSGSSPPSINGYSQAPTPYQMHHEDIVNHLYHSGFQTGNYADTILHVNQQAYRLHAIILSRSPFLAHMMSTSPQTSGQRVVYVHLENEPEISDEAFAIALGYLYSSHSMSIVNPGNARAVLAAGCLLGGMDEFCNYAYEVCKQTISLENITAWLEFVDSIPPSSDGSSTPISPHPVPPRTAIFGPYAQRLKDDIFYYLVVTLPQTLNVGGQATPASPHPDSQPSDAGRDTLLQVFARVPFDLFKTAMESPAFQIGSDQARFKFTKDAIELRKHGVARGQEETVVLAFGGGNFGGPANAVHVHVTRKLRKRPLWKVNS